MATAFHFLRENILSPPDLDPEEPLWVCTKPGSSPSSISAMAKRRRNKMAEIGWSADTQIGLSLELSLPGCVRNIFTLFPNFFKVLQNNHTHSFCLLKSITLFNLHLYDLIYAFIWYVFWCVFVCTFCFCDIFYFSPLRVL